MTGILTRALVERVCIRLKPVVLQMGGKSFAARKGLAVVVTAIPMINPSSALDGEEFEKGCYFVGHVGLGDDDDRKRWRSFALHKARLSARTGVASAQIQTMPQFLLAGDVKYWGGAVVGGIIGACSGFESAEDEMFGYWYAAAVQAEAKAVFAQLKEDRSTPFV